MIKTRTLAISLGVVAVVLMAFANRQRDVPSALVITSVLYVGSGFVFGWIRRVETWHWRLVIAAPLMSVLFFSMLFTGIFTKLWSHDTPIIVVALLAPCIGVFIANKLTGAESLR